MKPLLRILLTALLAAGVGVTACNDPTTGPAGVPRFAIQGTQRPDFRDHARTVSDAELFADAVKGDSIVMIGVKEPGATRGIGTRGTITVSEGRSRTRERSSARYGASRYAAISRTTRSSSPRSPPRHSRSSERILASITSCPAIRWRPLTPRHGRRRWRVHGTRNKSDGTSHGFVLTRRGRGPRANGMVRPPAV